MKKILIIFITVFLSAPLFAKICMVNEPTVIATHAQLAPSLVPAGSIIIMPVEHQHDGFLLCDGSEVSRTKYAKLFAVIGTTYGTGNGGNTFNLPDFQGMFLRGAGGNADAAGTKQLESAPNITGVLNPSYEFSVVDLASGAFRTDFVSIQSNEVPNVPPGTSHKRHTFDASRSNATYGRRNEVAPANYAVYYYIKY